jgi:hypothetical protein
MWIPWGKRLHRCGKPMRNPFGTWSPNSGFFTCYRVYEVCEWGYICPFILDEFEKMTSSRLGILEWWASVSGNYPEINVCVFSAIFRLVSHDSSATFTTKINRPLIILLISGTQLWWSHDYWMIRMLCDFVWNLWDIPFVYHISNECIIWMHSSQTNCI